jgi:hypothetical protein
MAKSFQELEAKMSPGARARSDAKTPIRASMKLCQHDFTRRVAFA